MADSFLPPAVLDLIANTAEWVEPLTDALEPLEGVRDAMSQVTAAAGDMSDAVGASFDGAAGAVAAADETIAAATEAMAGTVTASMGAVEAAIAEAAEASALSSAPLAAFSEGVLAAAANAGDLAAAQQALKAATAEASEAVGSLAEIQAAAGKGSDEYAAQLDVVATAMLRQEDAALQLRLAQEAQAEASAAAGAAADASAGQVAALGDAQAVAGGKAAAAGDEEEAASGKAAKGLKLWGLAAVAGIAISVKMAGDFQASMTRLVTSAGETKGNLAMVSQGILGMSVATNTSTSQLASGMYQVESAGFHGAAGLTVLKAAAEGAQAEGAELSDVANAVTSGLNAYGLSAKSATSFTNQMVTTVGQGKMTMQQLASSLSAVLPIAASYKISFAQVGGALATMTSMGESARQGTQNLAATIRSLGKPTSVATTEMSQFGISSTDVSSKLGQRGLTGTIQYLSDAVTSKMGKSGMVLVNAMNQSKSAAADATTMLARLPKSIQGVSKAYLDGSASYTTWYNATKGVGLTAKTMADQFASVAGKAHGFNNLLASGAPAAQTYSAAMAKMLGGATGLNVGLMLTGAHAATFDKHVKAVAASAQGAGANVKGWALIQSNFNFQLGAAEKAVQAMAISFGSALLPAATTVMKALASFGSWLSAHTAACKALAIVVGVLLAGALAHGLTSALKTAAGGFKDLGDGVKGAVGFFRAGEGEASQFGQILGGVGDAASAAWSGIVSGLSSAGGALAAAASSVAEFATATVAKMGEAAAATGAWIAEHAVAAAAFVAENAVMIASATAAFIAENLATLGIVAGIALLVAAIVYLATHWKQVWGDVKAAALDAWHYIDNDLIHPLEDGIADLVRWVESHWKLLATILATVLLGPVGGLVVFIVTHWAEVRRVTSDLVDDVTGFFERLPGRILAAVRDFPELLLQAGKDLVEGLIHGVEDMAGQAVGVVTHLGSDLLHAAGDILGIHSPSTEFAEIGDNIDLGLALGITRTSAKVLSTANTLMKDIVDAVAEGEITQSQADTLGLKVGAAMQAALRQSIGQAVGSSLQKELLETGKSTKATLVALAQVWDAVKGGLIDIPQASALAKFLKADNARLIDLTAKRASVAKELAAATALATSTAQAAESSYNLSSAATTASGGTASVSSVISTLKGDVAQIRKFATDIRKLARMGLNKAYLSQLISMGPAAGGALAAELASSGVADIKQVNAAEAAITTASNSLGNTAVSAMYTAGKQSGAGFLAGLKAQEKAIDAVMANIAATMVKRIRKDLGISSPSKVFFAHGQAIAQGLANGIASGVGQVSRAVGGLAAAASLAGTRSAGAAGALSAGRVQPIVIEQHSTFTGQLDGKTVFTSNKQQTYRYNIRNSGQVTGVAKPGA